MTALIWAANYGHSEVAKMLLAAGANLNAATKGGDTALMKAAIGGHVEIVRILRAAMNDSESRQRAAEEREAAERVKREQESAERARRERESAERAKREQESAERARRERESAERESEERARRQRESAESEKYARKNSEILFRRAMQKVHLDRAPEHLQGMCQKLTAELNAARKADDYRKIREIAESVGVSLSDGE